MPILGTVASSFQQVTGSYWSIASTSLTATANSISFTSIPSDYEYLQVRGIARFATGGLTNMVVLFNNDTSTGPWSIFYGNGNSASGGVAATWLGPTQYNLSAALVTGDGDAANYFGTFIMDIDGYSNTNKKVTYVSRTHANDAVAGEVRLQTGLWNSTATVTSLTFQWISGTSYSFVTGTTVSLYGIKKA